MKKLTGTLFRQGSSERIRQLLVTGKTFAVLSFSSMIFFVAAGLGGMVHQQASTSPVSSMKGFAAAVSSQMFAGMLGMEIPTFEGKQGSDEAFLGTQTAAFMLRMLTNVNPHDPRSLIASELPGLAADEAVLLRTGTGSKTGAGPKDQQPLPIAEADDEPSAPGKKDEARQRPGTGSKSNTAKPPAVAELPGNNGKKPGVSTPNADMKKSIYLSFASERIMVHRRRQQCGFQDG